MNKTHIIDTFSPELGCTVRDCIDCGCLVPGGPSRCVRCANETDPWHVRLRRWFRSFTRA